MLHLVMSAFIIQVSFVVFCLQKLKQKANMTSNDGGKEIKKD